MTPLKAELDALAAVLHTPLGDFLTDKDAGDEDRLTTLAQKRMFTKAIQAVDEARASRTMWMVVLRHGTTSVFYTGFGPYGTRDQGERAAQKLLSTLEATAYAVVATRNPEGLTELIARADELPPPVTVGKEQERVNLKRMAQLNRKEADHMRAVKVKHIGNVRDIRAKEGL